MRSPKRLWLGGDERVNLAGHNIRPSLLAAIEAFQSEYEIPHTSAAIRSLLRAGLTATSRGYRATVLDGLEDRYARETAEIRAQSARAERLLREEIDDLREELRQLQDERLPPAQLPSEWGLTQAEERYVRALAGASPSYLPSDVLIARVHTDPVRDLPDRKAAHIHMHKIRRKLAGRGIHFEQRNGCGYRVAPVSLPILRGFIGAERHPETRRAA